MVTDNNALHICLDAIREHLKDIGEVFLSYKVFVCLIYGK